MVSPGRLQALSEFRDADRDAIEPSVGRRGAVSYPTVDSHLDGADATGFLETMADRGLLAREFDAKLYGCRDCGAIGMQFATACPDCESIHAVAASEIRHRPCGETLDRTTAVEAHEADGHAAPADVDPGRDDADADPADVGAAEESAAQSDSATPGDVDATDGTATPPDAESPTDGDAGPETRAPSDSEPTADAGEEDVYCPHCETTADPRDLDVRQRYECQECEARFDDAAHRLWCRECGRVRATDDPREIPLYRYRLTAGGDRWVDAQLTARQSLVDALEARGYDVAVDATVPTTDDERVRVHVHAAEDLLGRRLLADVHDAPTAADVRRLVDAARAADAEPVIVSTDGALEAAVADLVDEADVTVLNATDRELTREYEVTDVPAESGGSGPLASVLDRARSVLEPQSTRRGT